MLEQVKKDIEKYNPRAKFQYVDILHGVAYIAKAKNGYAVFIVPLEEMGEVQFLPEMDSKDLIKWIFGAGLILKN